MLQSHLFHYKRLTLTLAASFCGMATPTLAQPPAPSPATLKLTLSSSEFREINTPHPVTLTPSQTMTESPVWSVPDAKCASGIPACTAKVLVGVYAAFHDNSTAHKVQCAGINTSDLCRNWQ
jgi:hypothetical protein